MTTVTISSGDSKVSQTFHMTEVRDRVGQGNALRLIEKAIDTVDWYEWRHYEEPYGDVSNDDWEASNCFPWEAP